MPVSNTVTADRENRRVRNPVGEQTGGPSFAIDAAMET